MLRSMDVASASISLTTRCGVAGRPRCLPRTWAAFIPAVTRSLMSDESSSAIAPMMVSIARPMGLSVSTSSRTLTKGTPRHALLIEDEVVRRARLRPDGRMVHDCYVFEVKRPEQSRGPCDLDALLDTIPGDTTFRPIAAGGCPRLLQ